MVLVALMTPLPSVHAAPSRAATEQKLVDDAREMGDWMAKLLAAQDNAINVLTPIETAWAELERVSPSRDQDAINSAYDQIDAAIGQAKLVLAQSKTEIDALPSLTGNKVMRELPVGHEDKLRKFAQDTIREFSAIVIKSEGMTAAAAAGDQEKTKEFANLMLDAREELLYGQRSRIEIMTAAAKRGSVNEVKLMVLGKATEAMHIIFKGEINIIRKQPAGFDTERLAALASEIMALAQQGRVAHKSDLARFGREKRYIVPAMIPVNERVFAINAEWLDYVDTLAPLFTAVSADVPAAGDDLVKLDAILARLVTVEDEYFRNSQKQVENMKGI